MIKSDGNVLKPCTQIDKFFVPTTILMKVFKFIRLKSCFLLLKTDFLKIQTYLRFMSNAVKFVIYGQLFNSKNLVLFDEVSRKVMQEIFKREINFISL